MKTQENGKRILVYGDSLTYGKQAGVNARLAAGVRYTGALQALFGGSVDVLEEGFRGRTLFGENPFFPDRNGLASFGAIIGSHLPFDGLVILLGTNDCNNNPDFVAQKHAASLREYMEKSRYYADFLAAPVPKVLVVLPPDIDESRFDEGGRKIFGTGANERIHALRAELARVAEELELPVLDASQVVTPAPEDGIHLDPENNRKLAAALHEKLRAMLQG